VEKLYPASRTTRLNSSQSWTNCTLHEQRLEMMEEE